MYGESVAGLFGFVRRHEQAIGREEEIPLCAPPLKLQTIFTAINDNNLHDRPH